MPEITEEELKALKDAQEEANALKSTNQRLLDESKKNKEKADEFSNKLNSLEEQKLKDEGKTQELLDKANLKNKELEDKLINSTTQIMNEKVRSEVAKVAKDVHDVDMLLRVKEHKSLLTIDKDQLSVTGIEDFVSKARETHSYLFGKKRMPTGDDGKPNTNNGGGDLDNLTDDQRFADELSKVSTRQEQAAVYKKYGKAVDSFMGNR